MYDQKILGHYAKVALEDGGLESCTMSDERTRQIESEFILNGIKCYTELNKAKEKNIKILDVGCGNGYTLSLVHSNFKNVELAGIEFTPELRLLANKKNLPNQIQPGDVRDLTSIPRGQDIIICQRVLINLLSKSDQIISLANIVESMNIGGFLIIIEAFQSGLDILNKCRNELSLPLIPPAHHNLYLEDDFFESIGSIALVETGKSANVLSTHYFVTRVLHDVALAATGSGFLRNSLFVSFFDDALPLGVGNFSPLKCFVFQKVQ